MSYYINDITSFSQKGFEPLLPEDFESESIQEIENVNTKYLQGKGLRHLPRTVRILDNVVEAILERNNLHAQKERLGLYNTNDICSLEAGIDFDREVDSLGVKLANPMKIPFTLNGATAGWIAIKNRLKNVNLTVHSGRCGLLSALNLISLDFRDGETDHAIVLGAHFMGEAYKKYNPPTGFNREVAVGLLVSAERTNHTLVEILESRSMAYDKKLLEKMLNEHPGPCFVESDFFIHLKKQENCSFISSTSPQLAYLPFFLYHPEGSVTETTIGKYFLIDKKGMMGYILFKRINHD